MIILLLLILAVLLFGPAKIKAWAGGVFVLGFVLIVVTTEGVVSTMFGNFWLWAVLFGCGAAAFLARLSGVSWRDILLGQHKPGKQ